VVYEGPEPIPEPESDNALDLSYFNMVNADG